MEPPPFSWARAAAFAASYRKDRRIPWFLVRRLRSYGIQRSGPGRCRLRGEVVVVVVRPAVELPVAESWYNKLFSDWGSSEWCRDSVGRFNLSFLHISLTWIDWTCCLLLDGIHELILYILFGHLSCWIYYSKEMSLGFLRLLVMRTGSRRSVVRDSEREREKHIFHIGFKRGPDARAAFACQGK